MGVLGDTVQPITSQLPSSVSAPQAPHSWSSWGRALLGSFGSPGPGPAWPIARARCTVWGVPSQGVFRGARGRVVGTRGGHFHADTPRFLRCGRGMSVFPRGPGPKSGTAAWGGGLGADASLVLGHALPRRAGGRGQAGARCVAGTEVRRASSSPPTLLTARPLPGRPSLVLAVDE